MTGSIKIGLLAIIIAGVPAIGAAQNYKIRQVVSMNGQKSDSTIYVKGQRKRSEGGGFMGMGGDVATVEQCDLKRNLKISDKKRMYAVEPYEQDVDMAPATAKQPASKPKNSPATKGGSITYVSNITDTGERKQMFGMTARRVKTSMSVEASPDACSKQDMKMETDGWYIDLPEFSCPVYFRPQVPPTANRNSGGCHDDIHFRSTGSGKPGFPLSETRTMSMGDMGMNFTQTTETLEFSKATLEAALFEIPQGYSLTEDAQSLYGRPDFSAMMKNAGANNDEDDDKPAKQKPSNMPSDMPGMNANPQSSAKREGVIRIGVYVPTNRNGDNVSTVNLQAFLVQRLTGGNVEAVAVATESDARAANCDFVLTSDFSKLKQSTAGKIGGMFGKVTNTNVGGNYEAQVDYKLQSLKTGQTTVQSKASAKDSSDVDKAAEGVLSQEAQNILDKVGKN